MDLRLGNSLLLRAERLYFNVFISFSLQWPTWVLFIAWVSYYLLGRNLKSCGTALLQIMAGILLGLVIRTSAEGLYGIFSQLAFPIVVFICIGSLAYLSKIKGLSNIPAWFIGLIIFFGVHPPLQVLPVLEMLIPVIIGFLFAFLNDQSIYLAHKRFENN